MYILRNDPHDIPIILTTAVPAINGAAGNYAPCDTARQTQNLWRRCSALEACAAVYYVYPNRHMYDES